MSDTAEAVCAVSEGSTALHDSSWTGNTVEVQRLLMSGADMHARDKVTHSSVHLVAPLQRKCIFVVQEASYR